MAAQTDLWGDLEVESLRTPVAIMKEQASLLGIKTNNVLEGKITTQVQGSDFHHSFNVGVPTLDDYTYELFTVYHPVSLYPVRVPYKGISLKTEDEFTTWLKAQLSSIETRRIVSSLLAQATS